MRSYGLYIHGQYIHGGQSRETRSPFQVGQPLAKYAFLTKDDDPEILELLLQGSWETFEQLQRDDGFFPLHERLSLLERLRTRISDQLEQLVHSITLEVGKPVTLARAEVRRALSTIEWTLMEAPAFLKGERLPTQSRGDWQGLEGWVVNEPRGPLLAISPFNFPLNLTLHKLAPAIAVGCPVILKPSPKSALVAVTIADFCHAVGMPAGMLSVIQCEDDVTLKIAQDARIKHVSFTGSAKVGWDFAAKIPGKPCALELGGNAPAFVDAGSDLKFAAKQLVTGAFTFAGQSCISVQNVTAESEVVDEFRNELIEAVSSLAWGSPLDEKVISGPVIDKQAVDRLRAKRAQAEKMGASMLAQATSAAIGVSEAEQKELGTFLRPTLFQNVPKNDPLFTEEVFGPYVNFYENDFESWMDECNENSARLQACLFTKDLKRAFTATKRLRYGGVLVNEASSFRLDPMPYGGRGSAGTGREGPAYAMREFTEVKAILMRT